MTSRNDITGDLITTKQPTEAYRNNFDAIFGKKKEKYKYYRHKDKFLDDTDYVRILADGSAVAECVCADGRIEASAVGMAFLTELVEDGLWVEIAKP